MSPSELVPNWSAPCIWSYVVPAAPFMAMASENDALSGEMKTFVSGCAAFTWPHRANENAFAASRTADSAAVIARGS